MTDEIRLVWDADAIQRGIADCMRSNGRAMRARDAANKSLMPVSARVAAMTDKQLEVVIAALVKRKDALDVDSAEYRFINRCLNGLRYSYELAGPIWEDLDPMGWGATPP
jgi:hypothetical protein